MKLDKLQNFLDGLRREDKITMLQTQSVMDAAKEAIEQGGSIGLKLDFRSEKVQATVVVKYKKPK